MKKLNENSPLKTLFGIEKLYAKNDILRDMQSLLRSAETRVQHVHEHMNIPKAMQLIGCSRDQMNAAIQDGIFRTARQDTWKYGAFYTIRADEVYRFKEKILSYPKTTEGNKAAAAFSRQIARRKKELAPICEKCGEIEIRKDSNAAQAYAEGDMSRAEAERLISAAHIRHDHTDYDDVRRKEYEANRKAGMDWEEAHYEAKVEARRKKGNTEVFQHGNNQASDRECK